VRFLPITDSHYWIPGGRGGRALERLNVAFVSVSQSMLQFRGVWRIFYRRRCSGGGGRIGGGWWYDRAARQRGKMGGVKL
jgi:hypothetical protein